jgi:hypothetical protein
MYFALFNLILDEEVSSLDVLGPLGGQEGPIDCQVDHGYIVYVYNVLFN